MRIAITEADRGFGFPLDLLPITLDFERDLNLQSAFGLLDMDHFIRLDEDFSVKKIAENLSALHDHHRKAFEASVTPEALKEWGAK